MVYLGSLVFLVLARKRWFLWVGVGLGRDPSNANRPATAQLDVPVQRRASRAPIRLQRN